MSRWAALRRVLPLLAVVPLLAAASRPVSLDAGASAGAARWKINTHLFAANMALADALNDGMVTIAPFGEFPVAASALRALRAAESAYRAGVLAPDLFPDMYVGGWFVHSDLSQSERWIADDWIRHVWSRGRSWPNADERDKVLAFTYGFLTHGAGDIFAHTWVNEKADGAWVSFWGKEKSTAFKHIVLEGFVGEHTPSTNLTLDVWPRFVSNVLIKDPIVRGHTKEVKHYQRWLAIYDALPKAIERAENQMNNNVHNDAPYWMKCSINPVPCARKEQAETWRLDINRGLRAIVDSSESLGEQLMAHSAGTGIGAMTGWASEWVPKMFGAHALGEGMAALSQFTQWAGDIVPIDSIIHAEVQQFVRQEFPRIWDIYRAAQNPATYMEQPGMFPAGTKTRVLQEMGVRSGGRTFDWNDFEPIYNSIVLSKLVLLDGDGLNELLRRAGVSRALFAPGEGSNIMLGVFRSMTHSYQWVGDTVVATTQFGICGPETGAPLPSRAVCGVQQRDWSGRLTMQTVGRSDAAGFALWGHEESREKVFRVIFKGFGPGPGSGSRLLAATTVASAAALRDGRRTLRLAGEHAEYLRDVAAGMQDKIAGVLAAPKAAAPVRGRTTAAPAPAAISDWGTRCCASDIARLRASLAALQQVGPRLQNTALLGQLGRRPSATQVAARAAQINASLTAFANTRDATAAAAAHAVIVRQIEALAAVLGGFQ